MAHLVLYCPSRPTVVLGTQDDHSFDSSSPPPDMCSKRNSASLDTADAGVEEDRPVKIHKVHFSYGKCALCCACHRGANRPAHFLDYLRTRKTPAHPAYRTTRKPSRTWFSNTVISRSTFWKASTTTRSLLARGECWSGELC